MSDITMSDANTSNEAIRRLNQVGELITQQQTVNRDTGNMNEMILEEGSRERSQRLCCGIPLQMIFNFIVVVGLLLLCSSVIFKFQQIDNKLKGLPTSDNKIKPEASSLTDDKPTCDIQCEQGVQGPPGPPGPKYVPEQILTSCDALKKAGFYFNGIYTIDPDGPNTGLDPFLVVCDMTSDLTMGYSIIHHNKEQEGIVNNAEDHASLHVNITYNLTSEQILAVKNVSSSCRQFIKYECIHSLFHGRGQYKGTYHYWISFDGKPMYNWGGVPTGTSGCACWMTRTCDNPAYLCNCDVNDSIPRQDHGYLTDKAALPVSQLRFGDTGGQGEKGVYTLGPLQCA